MSKPYLLGLLGLLSVSIIASAEDEKAKEETLSPSKVMGTAEAAKSVSPFDVGNRSQVFIDKALVGSAKGVEFTLHPAKKHPAGPWLRGGEKSGPVNPMVLYDEQEKIFKSWTPPNSYNTSRDGITWSEAGENPSNWCGIRRVWVMKDTKDPDPARRYKIIAFSPSGETAREVKPGMPEAELWPRLGYNTYISPDGREVTHLSQKHLLYFADGKPMFDRISGYYDKRHGLFVAFPKAERLKVKTSSSQVTGQRYAFSVITSKNFETWSEPKLMLLPDELDDAGAMARLEEVRPLLAGPTDLKAVKSQIYATGGAYQQESCVILFFWMLTCNDKKSDGPSEVQFAVSRDLERWERPFRQPVIPRGKVAREYTNGSDNAYAHSDWDSCWFNNVGSGIEVGDEVWVYYQAANTPHAHPATFSGTGRIPKDQHWKFGPVYKNGRGLAVWKRDRFVSVDAPAAGGTLTTAPVVFTGNRLELNAVTKPGGEVIVEVLDKDGKTLVRSKPFSGDDLRHRVEWEASPNLAGLAGKPVSLRFRMKSAELYAFAFRE